LNKEFEKRSREVLRILSILAKGARASGIELVFLGGSAIQASLKNPRRLSIDLDLYCAGEPDKLLSALDGAGYAIRKRRTHNILFELYNTTKEGVLVKVDFVKLRIPAEYIIERAAGPFMAKMPVPEYLMASKLASLSIGATGRKSRTEEIDLLKDLFDFNSLVDEFGVRPEKVGAAFEEITRQQNELRKTGYTAEEAYGASRKTLREAAVIGKGARITQGTLNNFDEYLIGGRGVLGKAKSGELVLGDDGQHLSRSGLATIALRALAYAGMVEKGKSVEGLDKRVENAYADKAFVADCERKLAEAGEDPDELHSLKFLAPKALLYLYYSRFPEA